MKIYSLFRMSFRFALIFTMSGLYGTTAAQPVKTLPDTSQMAYNGISERLKVYVYPGKGQSKQQQKQDEFECYKWAMDQSGIDPLNPPKVQSPATQTGPNGTMVIGGAKGAAAGVAIGAIAGNTGEGAAIGAVVGGLAGIRKRRMEKEKEQQQAAASEQQQQAAINSSYTKAFTACMQGKGYTVN